MDSQGSAESILGSSIPQVPIMTRASLLKAKEKGQVLLLQLCGDSWETSCLSHYEAILPRDHMPHSMLLLHHAGGASVLCSGYFSDLQSSSFLHQDGVEHDANGGSIIVLPAPLSRPCLCMFRVCMCIRR